MTVVGRVLVMVSATATATATVLVSRVLVGVPVSVLVCRRMVLTVGRCVAWKPCSFLLAQWDAER